jgi:hypothetical protein
MNEFDESKGEKNLFFFILNLNKIIKKKIIL